MVGIRKIGSGIDKGGDNIYRNYFTIPKKI